MRATLQTAEQTRCTKLSPLWPSSWHTHTPGVTKICIESVNIKFMALVFTVMFDPIENKNGLAKHLKVYNAIYKIRLALKKMKYKPLIRHAGFFLAVSACQSYMFARSFERHCCVWSSAFIRMFYYIFSNLCSTSHGFISSSSWDAPPLKSFRSDSLRKSVNCTSRTIADTKRIDKNHAAWV